MTTQRPPRPPTARAVELLTWIAGYCDERGYSPTVREMCRAFGWTSPNACMQHLHRLVRCGLLELVPTLCRTARVTEAGRAEIASRVGLDTDSAT